MKSNQGITGMVKSKGYIFLSDAHLNGFDEHTEAFHSLLRICCREGVEVFLLGDIFDLWFGKKNLTFSFQEKVIAEIASLSEKGLTVHYVEGNRDFFLVGSWVEQYFKTISDTELTITIGEKKILLLHGDTVNKHDIQYRFWKFLSKNSIVYSLFSAIPAGVALPLAKSFEEKLKRTNPRFRYNFPEDEGKAFSSIKFRGGYDALIIGHYHVEKLAISVHNGREKMFVCLPMWKEKWRYFYMKDDGGFGFRNFNPDSPLVD
jgi:UDP-2,3-diacylglucosamine hydrolase